MIFIDFFKNEERAECKEVEALPLLDINMCSHVLVRQKSMTFNKNINHRVRLPRFDFPVQHLLYKEPLKSISISVSRFYHLSSGIDTIIQWVDLYIIAQVQHC